MVHPEHPAIESSLLKNLLAPSSAFAIAFLFLVFQYTFKMEFQCPCNAYNNQAFCGIYFFLPFIGLILILTLPAKTCTIMCALYSTNRKSRSDGPPFGKSSSDEFDVSSSNGSASQSRRVWSQSRCSWAFRRVLFKQIFRNMFLSSFWIITILIDGDTLVCWTLTNENITEWYDQIPCKPKADLTAEESKSIKYYQSLSQIIGLSILFGIPIIWLLGSIIILSCKTPYKCLFEDVYEEETIASAEVEMRKRVKINATEKCESIFNQCKDKNNFNWNNLSNQLVDIIIEEDPASLKAISSATPEDSSATPEEHSSKKQESGSLHNLRSGGERASQSSTSVITIEHQP